MNSSFRRLVVVVTALFLGLATAVIPRVADGIPVSSEDLFLSPAAVPEALYPFQEVVLGISGTTRTYTSSDVGGTIVGVSILPLLVPNPSSASNQGEYTDAELAAINVNNFDSFFFHKPNEDYFADLTAAEVVIDYLAAGTFFVEITAESNGVQFTRIFEDDVDDFQGGIGARDPTRAGRVIASPNANLNLVSNRAFEPLGSNGYSPAAFLTLQSEGKNPQLVNGVQNAIAQIQARCQAAGGPISVALVGHGVPGAIQIGNTRITLNPRPNTNDMTPAQFQAAIDRVAAGPNAGQRCVQAIDFYSCNTGRGVQGAAFLQAMRNSIPNSRAFNQYTTAWAPYRILDRRTGQIRNVAGHFDVGAGGILGAQAVPEPATILLFVTAIGIVLVVVRRRRRANGAITQGGAFERTALAG